MQTNLVFINDVEPSTPTWSVKVRVEEKMESRQSMKTTTVYQRLILVDEKGTKIVATLYERDIEALKNTLLLNNTYIISKARVTTVKEEFKMLDNPYQWVINSKTAILRVNDDDVGASLMVPAFTPLSGLLDFLGSKSLIDVLVIVIDKLPQRSIVSKGRTIFLQDLGVVDSAMKPCVLTLWSNLATEFGSKLTVDVHTMPVVKFTRLIVNTYYGLSLGSTSTSGAFINPPSSETTKLVAWKRKNIAALRAIAEAKGYMSRSEVSGASDLLPFTDVRTAIVPGDHGKMKIRAKAKIEDFNQRCFYMACNKCPSSTTAELGWEFECARCQETRVAIPRSKVAVTLYDVSGEIEALAFGTTAEKIMHQTAATCMSNYTREVNDFLHDANADLSEEYVFIVRKRRVTRKDGDEDQYTIIEMVHNDDDDNALGSSVGEASEKLASETDSAAGGVNENFADLSMRSDKRVLVAADSDEDEPLNHEASQGHLPATIDEEDSSVPTKRVSRHLRLRDDPEDDNLPIISSIKRKKELG